MSSNTKRGHEGMVNLDGPAKMKVMDCGAEPGAKQVLRPLRFKCDDTRLQSHTCTHNSCCMYIYIYTHVHTHTANNITHMRLRASGSPMQSARLLKAGWAICVMTRPAAGIYNYIEVYVPLMIIRGALHMLCRWSEGKWGRCEPTRELRAAEGLHRYFDCRSQECQGPLAMYCSPSPYPRYRALDPRSCEPRKQTTIIAFQAAILYLSCVYGFWSARERKQRGRKGAIKASTT